MRWDDISLDLGRLFAGKSKTKSGRRRMALDTGTIAVLRAHRQDQEQRRRLLGADWQEHGCVLDRGVGRPAAPHWVEAVMERVVKRSGLSMARHTRYAIARHDLAQ